MRRGGVPFPVMTASPPTQAGLAPGSALVSGVRAVAATAAPDAVEGVVDVRVLSGRIVEIGPGLVPVEDEQVLDGGGRQLIPGLWDQHVHMGQWGMASTRLDLSEATEAGQVLHLVSEACRVAAPGEPVEGFGFRAGLWDPLPTTKMLDAVAGDHAVVLISADAHAGWLSSAAFSALGLPAAGGLVSEHRWFDIFARLGELPDATARRDAGMVAMARAASAKGVVGIGDMEFDDVTGGWSRALTAGATCLRVRAAVYPDGLDAVLAARSHTGDPVRHGGGLVRQGPLKLIADGTLGTRTAFCHEPFADATPAHDPHGEMAYTADELDDLLRRATEGYLDVAVHAIGDAAAAMALDSFARTGARGSIEHAQLLRREDISRMAALGITASVQPPHLLDDRDTVARSWPDRADRCFPFATLLRAGVRVVLGSDAPVSPLDPWNTMAAAVHRSDDDRDPWNPAEALTVSQALRASVDDQRIARGERGDLVLLDDDLPGDDLPTADAAARLRSMTVGMTMLGGRVVHGG